MGLVCCSAHQSDQECQAAWYAVFVAGRLPASKRSTTFDGRPWSDRLVLITSRRIEEADFSLPVDGNRPGLKAKYQIWAGGCAGYRTLIPAATGTKFGWAILGR